MRAAVWGQTSPFYSPTGPPALGAARGLALPPASWLRAESFYTPMGCRASLLSKPGEDFFSPPPKSPISIGGAQAGCIHPPLLAPASSRGCSQLVPHSLPTSLSKGMALKGSQGLQPPPPLAAPRLGTQGWMVGWCGASQILLLAGKGEAASGRRKQQEFHLAAQLPRGGCDLGEGRWGFVGGLSAGTGDSGSGVFGERGCREGCIQLNSDPPRQHPILLLVLWDAGGSEDAHYGAARPEPRVSHQHPNELRARVLWGC